MSIKSLKKKLLIITRDQFGYHIDTYYYCKYAKDYFSMTHIGFDTGKQKIEIEGINCKYVLRKGNIIMRYLRFLLALLKECRKEYDVIFIKYFIGCSLLKLFNRRKIFVFDVRTGSVTKAFFMRKLSDFICRFESCFFSYITVISKSLAKKLRLPEKKVHILPLGAKPIDVSLKRNNSLKLLYVGTLNGRRIEDTIEGYARFYEEFGGFVDTIYYIIGDGHNGELEKLRTLVKQKGLDQVIHLLGYIHQSKLEKYFHQCNVGISYIPINDIYDCQPPTKTYEYLLAGMPVLATKTSENAMVINSSNGILICDTADSFYEGLKKTMSTIKCYDPIEIKNNALLYSWKNIVKDNFIPYIDSLIVCGITRKD